MALERQAWRRSHHRRPHPRRLGAEAVKRSEVAPGGFVPGGSDDGLAQPDSQRLRRIVEDRGKGALEPR